MTTMIGLDHDVEVLFVPAHIDVPDRDQGVCKPFLLIKPLDEELRYSVHCPTCGKYVESHEYWPFQPVRLFPPGPPAAGTLKTARQAGDWSTEQWDQWARKRFCEWIVVDNGHVVSESHGPPAGVADAARLVHELDERAKIYTWVGMQREEWEALSAIIRSFFGAMPRVQG